MSDGWVKLSCPRCVATEACNKITSIGGAYAVQNCVAALEHIRDLVAPELCSKHAEEALPILIKRGILKG